MPNEIWKRLLESPDSEAMLQASIDHVVDGLSKMLQCTMYHSPVQVRTIPIPQIMSHNESPEKAIVGIYLRIESGPKGQAILILPLELALKLVDMVMESPKGTAQELGDVERSVLAEIGNLTLAYFLNSVADLTHRAELLLPSPPAVIVDMLGAILDIVVSPVAAICDELVLLETIFKNEANACSIRFWILPDVTDNENLTWT